MANLGDSVINDRERARDNRIIMSPGVRRLVDAGQRNEGVSRALSPEPMRSSFSNSAIDCQPAAQVAAEVSRRRARDETRTLADAVPSTQAARDHAERAEARLRQLEDSR